MPWFFFILETRLLAASRMATVSLIHLNHEYASIGQPEYFLAFGNLTLESMDSVDDTLHMLAFCSGGILLYYLLYNSKVIPHALSLWDLITIVPLSIGI